MFRRLFRRFGAAVRSAGRPQRGRPVCRVTFDLRSTPWAASPERAFALRRGQPGVLDVKVNARRGVAVVWHDGRTSFPQLFNWLQAQSSSDGDGR